MKLLLMLSIAYPLVVYDNVGVIVKILVSLNTTNWNVRTLRYHFYFEWHF